MNLPIAVDDGRFAPPSKQKIEIEKKTWFRKEHNLDTDTDVFDVTMRKEERWIRYH